MHGAFDMQISFYFYFFIIHSTKKLNKNTLTAYQASQRGGTLYCDFQGDRVQLSGRAALYSIAEINIGH